MAPGVRPCGQVSESPTHRPSALGRGQALAGPDRSPALDACLELSIALPFPVIVKIVGPGPHLCTHTAPPPPVQVLNRLTDRRVAVDKEALILGEPKKGMNDIFRHCRGFERAYSLMLQVGGFGGWVVGLLGGAWGRGMSGVT